MNRLLETLISIVFPRQCVVCNKFLEFGAKDYWYCPTCKPIPYAIENWELCEKCGRPLEHKGNCHLCNENKTYYDKGYVLYEYAGVIRDMIINFKFKDEKHLGIFFALNMSNYIEKHRNCDYDYICFVPMTTRKKMLRGYNQTEILAKHLSKNLNIPYKKLLIKIKNTKQQSKLSGVERMTNVKRVYKCNFDLKNKKVLIVDDIITTGSTINECCRTLKKAGAEKVDFYALAGVTQDY